MPRVPIRASQLEMPNARRRRVPVPITKYVQQHPDNRNAIRTAFYSASYTMMQLAKQFWLRYADIRQIVKLA